MQKLKIPLQLIVVISALLLLGVTMFNYEKKIPDWHIYRIGLLSICVVGYLLFLFYLYKMGNKKEFKNAVMLGGLMILISVLFLLFR